jgi:hypothetical protein
VYDMVPRNTAFALPTFLGDPRRLCTHGST